MAQVMADAALEKCHSMGYKISVSVIDRGGLTLATLRDENAELHTAESSDRKAYTARTFRQPPAAIVKSSTSRPSPASRNTPA